MASSFHFNDSDENIELLLRTVISANQLSVYGATADLCNELPEDLRAPGKLAAPDHLETMEIPSRPAIAETHTNAQQRGNLVQEYERKFEHMSEDQKLFKLCSDAGLKLVEKDSTSILLIQKKDKRCNIYAENTQCHETRGRLV